MHGLEVLFDSDIFEGAFDCEPVVLRAGEKAWNDLLTLDDVEYLIRTAPPVGEWLQLAKSGGFLPLSDSLVCADGFVRCSAVRKRVAQGYSVVLNHVRRRLKSVDAACSAVERAVERRGGYLLKHPLSSNVYATPPESTAFVPHYDGHGVLAFQVSGSKRWQIFARMNAGATDVLPRIEEPLAEPMMDLTLRDGDLLYVPRGYPHCAQAAGTHSVHLTLGLQCYTGSDFPWAAAAGIRAGQYVPRRLIEDAKAEVRARMSYDRGFAASCPVTETLIAPTPGSEVTRTAQNPGVVRTGEHVVFAFAGGAGRFPQHLEPALREIARQPAASRAATGLSRPEGGDLRTALYHLGFYSAMGE